MKKLKDFSSRWSTRHIISLTAFVLSALFLFTRFGFAREQKLIFSGVLRCDEAFCKIVSLEKTMGQQIIYVVGLPDGAVTQYGGVNVVVEGQDVPMYLDTRRIRISRIRLAQEKEREAGKLSAF
jgi:hypothetical protein